MNELNCGDLDEHLAPYVDGEQPDDVRGAVDAHLKMCAPCRRRAEGERIAREIVRSRREQLREAAPASLRESVSSFQSPVSSRSPIPHSPSPIPLYRRWVPLSLAATLLLAFAGVFLLGINDRVEALATGLALDHAKCFRVGTTTGEKDSAAAEARWQHAQGWPLTLPQSRDEQLTLVDVRRCLTADGWSAHVLYRWHGQPLSVYILPLVVGRDRIIEKLGHETAIWSGDGRTYAVLVDGRPPDFEHIVSYVKAHAK
jgi:putative zinc finger protein